MMRTRHSYLAAAGATQSFTHNARQLSDQAPGNGGQSLSQMLKLSANQMASAAATSL